MSFNPILGLLSGAGAGLQGIQQGQQAKQQRDMAMAQQKAEMEQQQFAMQQAQRKAGQQEIDAVVANGQKDPTLWQTPAFLNTLTAKYKQHGIYMPQKTNANGVPEIDREAIIGQPGVDIDAQPLDWKEKMSSFAPDQRKRFAPKLFSSSGGQAAVDAFMSAPAIPRPLTAGQDIEIQKNMQHFEDMVAKGLMTPGEFKQKVTAMIPSTQIPGYTGERLEGYLDPNGDFLKGALTKYTTSKIAQYEAMGLHVANRDKLAAGIAAEHVREFDINQNRLKNRDSAQLAIAGQRLALYGQSVANSSRNLNERLSMDEQTMGLRRDAAYWSRVKGGASGLDAASKNAEKQLADLRALGNQALAQNKPIPPEVEQQLNPFYGMDPNDPNAKPPDNLANQAAALARRAAEANIGVSNAAAQAISGITGHKTTVEGGQRYLPPSQPKTGAPPPDGWKRSGPARHDGAYPVSKDGVTKYWQPN